MRVEVDLPDLVREVIAIVACRVDVELHHDDMPRVSVDKCRLLQIVTNLISNAEDAIEEHRNMGGKIEIELRLVGETIEVRVTDNGCGIPEANLSSIFAHGFTTKEDGHGFGLHHSANAAVEMRGRLYAQSGGPGLGSTFVLYLPLDPAASETQLA